MEASESSKRAKRYQKRLQSALEAEELCSEVSDNIELDSESDTESSLSMPGDKNKSADADSDSKSNNREFLTILSSLEGLHRKLDGINETVSHPVHGLEPRMSHVEEENSELFTKVAKLEAENKHLKQNVQTLVGLVQKQSCDIKTLSNRVTDLTVRSMSQNVTISGLLYESNENCVDVVYDFLLDKVGIPSDEFNKADIS